ncbi:hypothetical protein [Calidithermus chliarophilus]|uniref:hypothetical protein n=1 Tax=Calidithermus chliarophilus TaxID=52023 RepID=UPI0004291E69|nr:hypothetical protein [Calidithermus chliarophilus]
MSRDAAIIGITGKAGHGKDTLYKLLLAAHGYERIALADPVKGVTLALEYARLVGSAPARATVVASAYYWWFGRKKHPEVRARLQEVGTEIVRDGVDPNFWVWMALKEIKAIVEDGGRAAVTDVRFPNEAAALRGDKGWMAGYYAHLEASQRPFLEPLRHDLTRTWEEGGVLPPAGAALIVKVVREGAPDPGEAGRHASEVGVDTITPDVLVKAASAHELVHAAYRALRPRLPVMPWAFVWFDDPKTLYPAPAL